MLLSDPASGLHDRQALTFLQAAHASGHTLDTAFFYHNGALAALNSEPATRAAWTRLTDFGLRCIVCRSALARAGHAIERLPEPFHAGGLGDWIEAQTRSDRVLSFGVFSP